LLFAAGVLFAFVVARTFVCHSAAQRRNLLLHLLLPLYFGCHPSPKAEDLLLSLPLLLLFAVAFAGTAARQQSLSKRTR
jgi:hypothetical protein